RGRLKRFIKLGGEMISLPQIENVLLDHFSRLEAAEAVEGPLLAVETKDEENPEIVLFSSLEISREEANSILRKAGLSGLHSIRRGMQIDELPVLGTGKTDYRALKGLLN
ncbi:MAG: hypothetical protein IJD04_05160, partial [Desulfovibrionaceae bacterium]|nr:hypothetical protein [Desulfovibrionaceae bacterium]